jgi:hypothetical protein
MEALAERLRDARRDDLRTRSAPSKVASVPVESLE